MKKLIAMLLCVAMVLCLFACTAKEPEPTVKPTEPPVTTEPVTEPQGSSVEAGTVWESVAEFHQEADETSVWQYLFYDPTDASYNPMGEFINHEGEDIHSWYPWEGSWVGVGFNNGEFCNVYGQALEQNADGPYGMISVIEFVAPADGVYAVTGKLMNTFDQNAGLYSVLKADGTVVVETDYRDYIKGSYTFMQPTTVELKAGEVLYFQPSSTNGWVSSYSELAVIYQPSEADLVKPEDLIIEPEYPTLTVDVTYSGNAVAMLNTESSTDGPFVYAITSDGANFEPLAVFIEREWDDDPEPDALEWYMSQDDYVGCGINADVEGFLEANVSDSFENGGSAAALGFKAPAAGTYSLTVYTRNVYNQNAEMVVGVCNGEIVAMVPFNEFGNALTLDAQMEAGEIVYFFGVSNGGWVSAYLNVVVNQFSAIAEFDGTMNGNWVYAQTNDGATFTPMAEFISREWDDDPEPDALEWYMGQDDYVGCGINMDMIGYLEANISDSFANGGTAAAVGFKAPAAGTYEITVVTLNAWGQDGGDVVVSAKGETVGTVPFNDMAFARTVTVTLEAGEVAYVYGTSNGGWVSAYLQVSANLIG